MINQHQVRLPFALTFSYLTVFTGIIIGSVVTHTFKHKQEVHAADQNTRRVSVHDSDKQRKTISDHRITFTILLDAAVSPL